MKKRRAQELARAIGTHLRRVRESLGITQEEAAERIGITVEYYARIERGKSLPSLLTFAQIAVALDVSTDELMGRSEITSRSAETLPSWFAQPDGDSKQLRRIHRRLRRVPPEVVSAVEAVLKQLERFLASQRKRSK